jgi:hypothetical protein
MVLALVAAVTPAPCAAVPAQDPATAREVLPGARLAGQGRLTWWGLAVYDARLWVQPGFAAADFAVHPFALELRYLRELRGSAIAQRSIDEMRRAGEFSEQQGEQWRQALARVLPDVRPGDRIVGVHAPGQGVSFVINGKPAVTIADPLFASLFFAIWLGPATSQPGLRDALLGAAQ